MPKKAITIIASEDSYENLASFSSIDELNKTVRHYKEKFKDQITKNAIRVLTELHNYSAKYFGCSFRSKQNLADSLNISRRTVIRACQLLESLGIIKQYETKRKSDMQQSSNAIVIQPIEEVVTQDSQEKDDICHTKSTTVLKQKNNTNHLNVKRSPYVKFVPESLQHYQAFFGKQIKELYSRVWLASKKLNISPNQSVMQSIGLTVMEQLKQYIKAGKQPSDEQLCKLAYAISYNQLEQKYGKKGELLDWGYLARKFLNK